MKPAVLAVGGAGEKLRPTAQSQLAANEYTGLGAKNRLPSSRLTIR